MNSQLHDALSQATILLVDDDPTMLSSLAAVFGDQYQTALAASGQEAIDAATSDKAIACVVMDIKMPGMDGITAAREIRSTNPDLPVIFFTGFAGQYSENDIDRSEKPFDFVTKGQSLTTLSRSIRNAIESFYLKTNNKLLTLYGETNYGIIGGSFAMQKVSALIRQAAQSNTRVMILGETGTGKELVARAIHAHSSRNNKQLAILNCNHKSPDLVESELFGHIKGAFTSAIADRTGLFEFADGGTVFLDEIGDLDITTQGKLLRVLETGEYLPVGSTSTRKTDTRLLCATHRDLEQMIKDGKFREDLYYRLKGVVITIPPLRSRKEDIPLLVERLCEKLTQASGAPMKIFDPSAIKALLEFDWPGNVRQLLNIIESAVVLTPSDLIIADDIYSLLNSSPVDGNNSRQRLSERLRDMERTLIIEALSETNYNVGAAAGLLGIDSSNLHKKIKSYAINIATQR